MAIDQKLIHRINELAKKKKEVGLSEAETLEQADLRQIYLSEFRQGFKQKIESVEFLKQFTIKKANVSKEKVEELRNHEKIKEVEELANTYLITYYSQKISEKEVKFLIKK